MPSIARSRSAGSGTRRLANFIQYGDGPSVICDDLRTRIVTGELPTGSELKIQELAKDFGTSIMPVREALRTLAAEGLVEMRPRRSPLVASPDIAEVLEINEIRQALEPIALLAAIPRHTKVTLARCRRIIAADRDCTDEWKRIKFNWQFHSQLLVPSGKARMLQTIREQHGTISIFVQFLVVKKNFMRGEVHHEHEAILDAVERCDSSAALNRLEDHLRESGKRLQKLLEDRMSPTWSKRASNPNSEIESCQCTDKPQSQDQLPL